MSLPYSLCTPTYPQIWLTIYTPNPTRLNCMQFKDTHTHTNHTPWFFSSPCLCSFFPLTNFLLVYSSLFTVFYFMYYILQDCLSDSPLHLKLNIEAFFCTPFYSLFIFISWQYDTRNNDLLWLFLGHNTLEVPNSCLYLSASFCYCYIWDIQYIVTE